MSISPATHTLGPDVTDLLLGTTSEGKMARMGHDLTLLVGDWHGVLVVGESPGTSSLRMSAALESLRVLSGQGGAQPLTDEGRSKIVRNALSILNAAQYPELGFTSTAMDGTWQQGRIEGMLTLNGHTEVQQFTVTGDGQGKFTLTGTITQTRFGIKPYSAMMGALKLGDDVSVTVELAV